MSWSASACGPANKIAGQLEQQLTSFKMNDAGEQETIQHVKQLIAQVITTVDPEKIFRITASGSMSFKDWSNKTGPYQSVDLKIEPIHFTV